MTDAAANADQIDYWNAAGGTIWAELQERLDRQNAPLGLAGIQALRPLPGERILDIGCGAGETSLQLSALIGRAGQVVGVDISQPLLDVARHRPWPADGAPVEFRQADAQTADLGAGQFDGVYSRFGVMFFDKPVEAFGNIRKALKPGGRLTFVCWRTYSENAWMREPMEAAQPFLPASPPSDPHAPGPFAFADAARTGAMLANAGFVDVGSAAVDLGVGGSSLEDSLDLAFRVGPLGRALRENPGSRDQVTDAVRKVLERYVTPEGTRMPAAVWVVTARNP